MATDWINADDETVAREMGIRFEAVKDRPRSELTEPERNLLDMVNEFARSRPAVYQTYVPGEDA
jgi:hypothetical protein